MCCRGRLLVFGAVGQRELSRAQATAELSDQDLHTDARAWREAVADKMPAIPAGTAEALKGLFHAVDGVDGVHIVQAAMQADHELVSLAQQGVTAVTLTNDSDHVNLGCGLVMRCCTNFGAFKPPAGCYQLGALRKSVV